MELLLWSTYLFAFFVWALIKSDYFYHNRTAQCVTNCMRPKVRRQKHTYTRTSEVKTETNNKYIFNAKQNARKIRIIISVMGHFASQNKENVRDENSRASLFCKSSQENYQNQKIDSNFIKFLPGIPMRIII